MCVRGGLSGCSVCAPLLVCMCVLRALMSISVKCLLNHPGILFFFFFFKFSHAHKHARAATLISRSSRVSKHTCTCTRTRVRTHTQCIDLAPWEKVAGEQDLIEFHPPVSIDPTQYQHGFSGLRRQGQYASLRKSLA